VAVDDAVLNHPPSLGDLPAEIVLIHHRHEAAQHRADDHQHGEETVQLSVQAFCKTFVRHCDIEPLLRRAVKPAERTRSQTLLEQGMGQDGV